MNKDYATKIEGLYCGEKMVANAHFQILGLYSSDGNDNPEAVTIAVTVIGLPTEEATFPLSELNYAHLHREFPLLNAPNRTARQLLDRYFIDLVIEAKQRPATPQGPFFHIGGLHRMKNGVWVAVEGNELLGPSPTFYASTPQIRKIRMLRSNEERPVTKMMRLLFKLPLFPMLLLAYVLTSLVRSAVLGAGVDFQAVAWLYGGQGKGKTTAARRFAGIFTSAEDPSCRPALFYDLGSTASAVREAMTRYRDAPIILDDVCFSASRTSRVRRTELAAQIVREAANAADIIKKGKNGENLPLRNAAGVILTAEFSLENQSDVTRCVMLKVAEQLNMPSELTPQLSGAVARAFLVRFLPRADDYLQRLRAGIPTPDLFRDCEPRVGGVSN